MDRRDFLKALGLFASMPFMSKLKFLNREPVKEGIAAVADKGIELLAPDVYKKFGGKGLTGLAGKILNLTPRIAGAMTPVGLGITAVGLGKMGYDAIQKDVQRMKNEGTYQDFLEEQEEIQQMGYGGALWIDEIF